MTFRQYVIFGDAGDDMKVLLEWLELQQAYVIDKGIQDGKPWALYTRGPLSHKGSPYGDYRDIRKKAERKRG